MGSHWYARSPELIDVGNESIEIERRIVNPEAKPKEIDEGLDAREALFVREAAVRAELDERGAAITIKSLDWPARVRAHLDALGPSSPDDRVLDRIGWGTSYYAENLRLAGVPMDGFSQRLEYLSLSPVESRQLAEELLAYADRPHEAAQVQSARVAGLWLYLWGSLGCFIESGD